jgi:uncharacterized protein YggE
MRSVWAVLVAAVLSAWTPSGVPAEETPRNITVVGVGRDQGTPDLARISFSVEHTAPTAEAASQTAAKTATQLLEALEKAIGQDGKVQTAGYQLNPVYRQDGGERIPPDRPRRPEIVGYTATNEIQAETRKVDGVGTLIDLAIRAGATRVGDVAFTLRDPAPARNRAYKTAGADAATQANAIADALQVRVVRVLEATTESTTAPVFYKRTMAMAAESVATPIAPGEVTTEVRLRVTYGIE